MHFSCQQTTLLSSETQVKSPGLYLCTWPPAILSMHLNENQELHCRKYSIKRNKKQLKLPSVGLANQLRDVLNSNQLKCSLSSTKSSPVFRSLKCNPAASVRVLLCIPTTNNVFTTVGLFCVFFVVVKVFIL